MTSSDTSSGGGRLVAQTGRSTVRRVRSAIVLWRAAVRLSDVVAACILIALAAGLGAYIFVRAKAAARLAFAEQAQRLQASVNEKMSLPGEDLKVLATFFEASGNVTRRQFRLFTSPMLQRSRRVDALEWLPLVAGKDLAAFEAEAHGAGLIDYRVWENGADGKSRPAGSRPIHVPIHYMEPPSMGALGFDIASDPHRWGVAETARDSGDTAVSRPFHLIEDAGKAGALPAVAVYSPVYKDGDPESVAARRASLAGFVLAIFRVAPLADAAAAAPDSDGLAFVLRDGRSTAAPVLAERPAGAAALAQRPGFVLEFPVPVVDAENPWVLKVFPLPHAFLPSRRGAIEVALVGALAALLGLVAAASLRAITRLRRQVEKVGPYRLVARLGRGAMGVVWEARHALLRRPTAVKLLAPGTGGERALARFEREVQLTAGLTHPSTIAIYDYGRTGDGVFYYAMELLRGINLQQLVNFDGPLPPGRVVNLLRQACGALSEAHAAGLIHRDIKPANMMICERGGIPDFLKVLDFGLVKDVGAVEPVPGEDGDEYDPGLSQDGSLLGTPLYMGPEGMSDPSKVDARTDIFALGAVGYYLLGGKPPFPGHTAMEVFTLERQGNPAPLPAGVPPALEAALRRCLQFKREDRPGSAEELDALLAACAIDPPWSREEALAWWRDRGAQALAMARPEREERYQFLNLSSDSRLRS